MKRNTIITFCALLIFNLQAQQKVVFNDLTGTGHYLDTEWGETYFEVFGEGDPLLILHGNGGSAKSKRHITEQFAKTKMVIAIDSRCHGNSSCPDDDLDYFELAKDVYRVMEHLGYDKYEIWGHSDGGILGLILGYTHTDRIDRMLISGANANLKGLESELVEIMSNYEKIGNPVLKKHIKLMYKQRPIPMEELRKVNVPVMLMVGDRDAVQLEHTIALFRTLPMAQLCILPGTTHFIENEKKEQLIYWFNELQKPFATPSTVQIAEQMAKSLFSDH